MTTSSECRSKSDYVWRSCLGAESWYLAAGYQKSEPSYSLGSWQRISCDSSRTGKMITAGELGTAGGGGWKRRAALKWPCLTNRAESELVSSMLVIVKMCRAANTNGRSVRHIAPTFRLHFLQRWNKSTYMEMSISSDCSSWAGFHIWGRDTNPRILGFQSSLHWSVWTAAFCIQNEKKKNRWSLTQFMCTGVWSASQLNATMLTHITGLLQNAIPQDFLSLQEQSYPRSSQS